MKAIVYERYGPPEVLELREVERPVPGDGELLVRIRASSINPLDWHYMRGDPYAMRLVSGFLRPKVPRLGADLAGVVEAVGKEVDGFGPGDEVYGAVRGAWAEYVCAPPEALARKPASLTFEQAAAVPIAAWTALQFLRDHGAIRPGERLLVNGASGGVGTFAVQIAVTLDAEVTGVCSSRNVEMVRSIGALDVIDYTQDDPTKGKPRYDLVLDNIGNHSLSEWARVLKPGGRFLLVGAQNGSWLGPLAFMLRTQMSGLFASQRVISRTAQRSAEDLEFLNELFDTGKVTPVVDRIVPLADAAAAVAYVEAGHARGKVVISI